MKITVKTIKNEMYPVEVPDDVNVGDFKAKASEASGLPKEGMRIVAKGQVLSADDKKLTDYNLADGDFVVVMGTKPKVQKPEDSGPKPAVSIQGSADASAAASQAQPASSTQPPAQTQAQTQPPAQTQPVAQPQPTQPAPQQTATQLPPGLTEDDLSTLVGITNKPRDFCLQILAMTKNLDLACQVIFEGITPDQLRQLGQAQAMMGGEGAEDDYGDEMSGQMPGMGAGMGGAGMGGGAMPGMGAGAGAGMGGGGGSISQQQAAATFQQFASNPLFRQVVDRLRQDPSFYTEFMNQLQTQNPQLMQTINEHPMMFMNLCMTGDPNAINFGGMGGGMGGMPGMAGAGMGGAGMGGAGAGGAGNRGAGGSGRQIQVSAQEFESISRLEALGFPKGACLEALRACDGNEELAADFLFSTAMEDENEMMQHAAAASHQSAQQPAAQQQPAQQQQPSQEQQPATDATAAEQQQPQPGASAEANDAQQNPDNNNNNPGGQDGSGAGGEGGAGGDEKSAFD